MAVITAHYVRSADQHLAVFGDDYFNAVEWFADRTDAIVVRTIGRHDAGFGHAIALQNIYARPQKRIRKRGRKRRAAGNKVTQAPADALAPLGKHQPVGDRMS